MQITIDTNNLSELDIAMLSFLAEQGEVAEEPEEPTPAPAPAKATAATKKSAAAAAPAPAAEPEPEPEPTPEPDEDLLGGAPTMADAVARATVLVSEGGAAKVKEALATVGAKRVSEMAETDIPAFLAALDAE